MSSTRRAIPVYRASLPRAERLLPYLARIDASRWYTNRGELVEALETRLGALLGARSAKVISAASGTAAIEGAILASAGPARAARPLALIPAYTFVATAMAAERCGYVPYLLDVDPQTWSLVPERLSAHPALVRAGVVVPVAPYGRAVAQAGWIAFRERTNVPVVIDAAAAFEALLADPTQLLGPIPVALSFQATKTFSTAEGGAVVWDDAAGLERIAQALNFGMLRKRESTSTGTNGKLSAYHAAVGLASLDAWEERARTNRALTDAYRRAAAQHGLGAPLHVAPQIASNYALLDAGSPGAATELAAALQADGIESRWWYGRGLHRESYYREVARDPLPHTERLAPSILGLPIYPDIAVADVERTLAIAAQIIAPAAR